MIFSNETRLTKIMLETLFAEIDALHMSTRVSNSSDIDSFEKQTGYRLPEDLKAFYRRYETVKLFPSEFGPMYRFVPVREIHPTRYDIYGAFAEENLGPDNWLTICDVLDGNYIAIDIDSYNGDEWNFIDCFHETFAIPGESPIIAKTFTELLDHALHSGNEQLFYLQKGFKDYGDGRPLTAENASLRIENPKAPRKGWIVTFSLNKQKSFREFFADGDYGGKEKCFEAIKEIIEKYKQETGDNRSL